LSEALEEFEVQFGDDQFIQEPKRALGRIHFKMLSILTTADRLCRIQTGQAAAEQLVA